MAKKKTEAAAPKRRKKASAASQWVGPQRDPGLDRAFSAALTSAQDCLGTEAVSVASTTETASVGLPLPGLSLRFLFQSTVFLLSRIIQIAGEEGSCKSQVLHEIARWHNVYGGGGGIASNENKDTPVMRAAVFNWQQMWIDRCQVVRTAASNEWQKWLLNQFTFWRGLMDSKDGPGRTLPIYLGVDSLTATDTQSVIDDTLARGFSQRGYSELALVISRYLRVVPSQMTNYPFTLIYTNHMKPATDHMGRPKKNVPGGKSVPFMATYLLETHKVKDIDVADYQGIRVGFKLEKNAGGTSRRWIEAELLWWHQEDDVDPQSGQPRLHAVWDWNTASIEVLSNFESRVQGKKTLYNDLMDITGLHLDRKQRKGWSNILGVPESDPQNYRDLAGLLEGRPELLAQIYPLLGIETYAAFQPGMDYRLMLEEARNNGAVQAAKILYANLEDMPALDPAALSAADTPAETDLVQ